MGIRVGVAAVFVVCAGLACGSSTKPVPGSDGSAGAGGSDGGSATDGQPVHDDVGTTSDVRDTSAASEVPMREMCEAGRAKYDAAAYADARCNSPDDTDRDGVEDCLDGCPYDATKVVAGVCGCGIPDVDSDGDGIADCIDNCPLDPNNVDFGSCGCVNKSPGVQPKGTACGDPACPQPGATCDGAGVCGDRSACSPCPGGRYVVTSDLHRQYWICGAVLPAVTGPGCSPEDTGTGGGATTRAAAQAACQAKGLTLARIDGFMDNDYVAQLLTAPLWIGANDLQTAGQWYWPSATSDSDKLFWSGGPDGGQESQAFSNWASTAPGAKSCATIRTDGRWVDTDCSETHGYICEYQIF
jgi:hypothetical protein